MPKLDGLALLGLDAGAGTARARTMKLGACDYLVKPFDPGELVLRIRRILSESALAGQAEAGRRAAQTGGWIGEDEKSKAVRALVEKVAGRARHSPGPSAPRVPDGRTIKSAS